MELLGQIVLYIIMGCCGAGAIATVVKEDSGLAQSFHDGIRAMASLFCLLWGLMVSSSLFGDRCGEYFWRYLSFYRGGSRHCGSSHHPSRLRRVCSIPRFGTQS